MATKIETGGGYQAGYDDGYSAGNSAGYNKGYSDGRANLQYYPYGKIYKVDATLNGGTGIWGLSTTDVSMSGTGGTYSGAYNTPFMNGYAEWAWSNTLYFTFRLPIEIVGFMHRRDGNADRFLSAYNIAYSDDNSNWNIVKSESGLPSKDGIINYEFNSVGKHYYWRLYLQSNNSNQCLNYLGFIAKI